MSPYIVYELELPDGTFYAGVPQYLEKRLTQHRKGRVGYGEHSYVDYGILGGYMSREEAFEAEEVAIERLMSLGVCANRKRSGHHYSEKQQASVRESMRRLYEGERMMWGRTRVPALRRALNGEFLVGGDR